MQAENPTSILWLTENYYPNTGGMAQSCDRIVQGLRDSGLNISLVHFRPAKTYEKLKMVKNGFNLVFPVGEDEGHIFNLLYDFLCSPTISYKFSHIVAFGGYLPLLGAPILSKLLNIPLISMLRGNDFDLALFSAKKREMLFYALNHSKIICTVSTENKIKIEKLIVHSDIRFIPNGIGMMSWEPHLSESNRSVSWKNDNVPKNKKVIGIFGHLKPKKGIDFFIDSIIRSGNGDKLFLLITGELYPEILEKLELSGVQYHISPFLNRYELLAWYPICDIVAIPSFYDGMPNVLLEAGALGIPIISANVGGMKDILEDNETGFLFHPGDREACSEAIIRFLRSEKKILIKMGQILKQLIEKNYNLEVEIGNYLKIFQAK
jgi:glycogen synthase